MSAEQNFEPCYCARCQGKVPAGECPIHGTSNLVSELEAWITTEGRVYSCGRDYPGSWRKHDKDCACCLMIASARALKSPAVETPATQHGRFPRGTKVRFLGSLLPGTPTDGWEVETIDDPRPLKYRIRHANGSLVDVLPELIALDSSEKAPAPRTDHADNLAKALEHYLNAHDTLSGVQSSDEATGQNDANDGGFQDKANDAWRAMRTALHEYRKHSPLKTEAPHGVEPLMITCYECDACNVFTPITHSICMGCRKPFSLPR